ADDGADVFFGVAVDPTDDSVITVGRVVVDGLYDGVVSKYSSAGAEDWTVTNTGSSGASSDVLYGVVVDGDTNIGVTGIEENLPNEGVNTLFVRQLDASGVELW